MFSKERLGLLVDQQWNWRENQALGRRLKNARLRTNACVEDIDYRGTRGLEKSVIRALVQESAWVGTHENVFVLGPTGVGKSFVACASSEGVPRRVLGSLHPSPIAIPRPSDCACRWQPPQSAGAASGTTRVEVIALCQNPWRVEAQAEAQSKYFQPSVNAL
jgi:hypothetical protein